MKQNINKLLLIFVIFLSILVFGLSSYLIYDKIIDKNINKNNINNNDSENMIDIEDAEVITSLKEQVNNFELLSWQLKTGWFYENDRTLINELDIEKTILLATKFSLDKIWDATYEEKNSDNSYTYAIISENDLKRLLLESGYINDETILENLKEINGCPIITYDSKYNGYIVNGSCGFTHDIISYDYKLEKNKLKNEYYLYRSVAYNGYGESYKNITKLEDKEINKDNYTKYSKFKITFKDNLLYSIEKIN